MEDSLEQNLKNGNRYVVVYKSNDGTDFYLTKLLVSQEQADKKVTDMINEKTSLLKEFPNGLRLLRVYALSGVANNKPVMLWTDRTKYLDLERICENNGAAISTIRGTELQKCFFISPFSQEVVKTYKVEKEDVKNSEVGILSKFLSSVKGFFKVFYESRT